MIGLGIMGRPMAKNLLKASYDLAAANRNKAVADEPVSVEARAVSNAEIGAAVQPGPDHEQQMRLGRPQLHHQV